MKKLFIIMLAFSLLLSGCSIAGGERERTDAQEPAATAKPTEEPTAEPTEEPELTTGTVSGDTYELEYFKLGFRLPEGFRFFER